VLLNIYERRRDEKALEIAVRCGDHLRRKARITNKGAVWPLHDSVQNRYLNLGGFSHGTSGICQALFRLAAFSKNEEHFEMAKEALRYDRSLYDNEFSGWLDMRENRPFDGSAWCHGSAGIGLSRLLVQMHYSDELFEEECEIALGNTITRGIGNNQCVCHGDIGNIEIIYALASSTGNKDAIRIAENRINNLIAMKKAGKRWKSGKLHCGSELLGFFMGLAGMGYGLLRLALWDSIPSIIALEGPSMSFRNLHIKDTMTF
jgi:lantibiotic modifying enzyme